MNTAIIVVIMIAAARIGYGLANVLSIRKNAREINAAEGGQAIVFTDGMVEEEMEGFVLESSSMEGVFRMKDERGNMVVFATIDSIFEDMGTPALHMSGVGIFVDNSTFLHMLPLERVPWNFRVTFSFARSSCPKLTPGEFMAMLLHEQGHSKQNTVLGYMKFKLWNKLKEFGADRYAKKAGYGQEMQSLLEKVCGDERRDLVYKAKNLISSDHPSFRLRILFLNF